MIVIKNDNFNAICGHIFSFSGGQDPRITVQDETAPYVPGRPLAAIATIIGHP
jgi:hypothetical protein